MTRSRIVKVSVLVATATLALSGCGLHPGAAAVVGDDSISDERVDDVASALCTANIKGAEAQGQQAPSLPTRGARQGALQILVDNELSQQFGAHEGVDPSQAEVSKAMQQNAPMTRLLPAGERAAFEDVLRGYAESQLILIEVGRRSLADSGQADAPDDAALAEGTKLRGEWAASLDVEVDPRYGTYEKGQLTPESGSLSVPASGNAFEGQKSDPSRTWIDSLPASQKCG